MHAQAVQTHIRRMCMVQNSSNDAHRSLLQAHYQPAVEAAPMTSRSLRVLKRTCHGCVAGGRVADAEIIRFMRSTPDNT